MCIERQNYGCENEGEVAKQESSSSNLPKFHNPPISFSSKKGVKDSSMKQAPKKSPAVVLSFSFRIVSGRSLRPWWLDDQSSHRPFTILSSTAVSPWTLPLLTFLPTASPWIRWLILNLSSTCLWDNMLFAAELDSRVASAASLDYLNVLLS